MNSDTWLEHIVQIFVRERRKMNTDCWWEENKNKLYFGSTVLITVKRMWLVLGELKILLTLFTTDQDNTPKNKENLKNVFYFQSVMRSNVLKFIPPTSTTFIIRTSVEIKTTQNNCLIHLFILLSLTATSIFVHQYKLNCYRKKSKQTKI